MSTSTFVQILGRSLRGEVTARASVSHRHTPVRLMKGNHSRLERNAWCQEDLKKLPAHLRPSEDETLDLILRYKIFMLQARRGYRANTDSQVLAYFAMSRLLEINALSEVKVVADVGAGNGLVSILFGQSLKARGYANARLELLEIQPALVQRANRNLKLNGSQDGATIHECSVAGGHIPDGLECQCNVVLCNPPFYQLRDRTPPAQEEKRTAYFETCATIDDFVSASKRLLVKGRSKAGRAFWIFPYEFKHRLLHAIEDHSMCISYLTEVFHDNEDGTKPVRILVEAHTGPVQANTGVDRLVLHPDGIQKRYGEQLEKHLQSLPGPLWRIGRLRDPVVWAEAHTVRPRTK